MFKTHLKNVANPMQHLPVFQCQLATFETHCKTKQSRTRFCDLITGFYAHARTCAPPVPTALRVNGPTEGLGVDGRPPLLSPTQVSLGPQVQGYRSSNIAVSPGKSFKSKSQVLKVLAFSLFFAVCLSLDLFFCHFSIICDGLQWASQEAPPQLAS